MLDLLVATDAVRRRTKESHTPKAPRLDTRKAVRPGRTALRATSAAALRGLANRLEPSPTT
jgi:hypothetical protein